MRKPLKFTIFAGPYTTWKIEVNVWPTAPAMHKAYLQASPPIESDPTCVAFCDTLDLPQIGKRGDGVIAIVHFSKRGGVELGSVIHEGYHGFVNFAKLSGLMLTGKELTGEEWAAESLTYIIEEILAGLKKNKVVIHQ